MKADNKEIMTRQKKGTVLVLISALMFGSYGVWSRLMGDVFDNFYQGWTRALIIFIILLPIILWRKEIKPIARGDLKWFIVFLLFTSLTQAPLYYAFNHMDIGTATLLFFVTMLLTMYVVGFAFLKEKATRVKVVSLLVALAGLYLTFSFSIEAFTLLAASMAVLNGIASGGEVAFSKKLSNKYSPLYLVAWSWLIIFVTNSIISVAIGEIQHLPSFSLVWLYQAGYVVASLFGFWLIIEGLKYIEASIGGLIGLLEVVFGVGFGILIFGESLTLKIIAGGALIIAAAALPHIKDLIVKRQRTSLV